MRRDDAVLSSTSSGLPAMRRRDWLALFGAGLALAACGGQGGDGLPAGSARILADSAGSDTAVGTDGGALVGVVYGAVTADDRALVAAGVRELGQSARLMTTDLMMIGSNMKAMTAAIAARLVERGLVAWSTKIAEAIPSLGSGMSPVYAGVTLEELLAHRGGLMAFKDSEDIAAFQAYLQAFTGTLPDDERGRRLFFLDWVLRQQPPAGVVPGATFAYSNAGYALVGAMLEAVSGLAYETLWANEIGGPLGIEGLWVRPELTGRPAAWGHDGAAGQVVVEPTPDADDQAWFDVIIPVGLGGLKFEAQHSG